MLGGYQLMAVPTVRPRILLLCNLAVRIRSVHVKTGVVACRWSNAVPLIANSQP